MEISTGGHEGAIVAAPSRTSEYEVPKLELRAQVPSRLVPEPEDISWQDYGNCLGVDPDLFFPERGASTADARKVCGACVVREECLEFALVNGEKFGIWGGTTERERRRLRKQRVLAGRAGSTALAD